MLIRYLRDTPVLFPFTKALDKFIFKEKAKEWGHDAFRGSDIVITTRETTTVNKRLAKNLSFICNTYRSESNSECHVLNICRLKIGEATGKQLFKMTRLETNFTQKGKHVWRIVWWNVCGCNSGQPCQGELPEQCLRNMTCCDFFPCMAFQKIS